jgi:L-lactate dehydrogenase complex protein LldG
MANKEAFLNRLAGKMGRPRIQEVKKPQWHRHPWDHLHQGLSQNELVDQFEETLQSLGGQVIRVASHELLPSAINSWLIEMKVKRIVSWKHDSATGEVLQDTLQEFRRHPSERQHSSESGHSPNPEQSSKSERLSEPQVTLWDEQADSQHLTEAAEKADVGFTIAEYGLSETGTVVLYNRGNCGRLVSLLPTISATILSSQTIIPRLTQLLPHIDQNVADYSCINLITGPSRSADIEMDLSVGVHGPGQLVVFLIEDQDTPPF